MKSSWLAFLFFLLAIFCFAYIAKADEPKEEMVTITVPKSSLTPQQQEVTKQQEVKGWVGIGKEIGDAVNSSLSAVTTQSNNFAHTPVGILTAAVVIWKLLGGDLVHIFGGILFALTITPLWIWSYRRMCLPRRVLTKETINPDKTKIREWDIVNGNISNGDLEGWIAGHWGGACLIVIITLVTIFSY